MASTQILQRRIKSVRSTRQITKAMELVAASKMRRATEVAHMGRSYREAAHDLLSRLATVTDVQEHPLFIKREIKTRLYVAITSDRGLAGAYNANIVKMLTRAALENKKAGIHTKAIVIGTRGVQFVRRLQEIELVAAFQNIGDQPTANAIRPVLTSVVEQYMNGSVDDVQLLYTMHKSNILQVASALSLLPARLPSSEETESSRFSTAEAGPARLDETSDTATESLDNVTFEPDITAVLDNVTERLLEVQIWQALLESIASEHSMRMLSMKNATDNANDLIGDLTLAFNTARQANITQEIAEVTGGAEAMK